MKKIVKSATLAVALVSCASIALPALSQASVFAAEHQRAIVSIESGDVDKYLKVLNFVSTGNVGEKYTFATAKAVSISGEAVTAYSTEITLTNPYGIDVTSSIEDRAFTPNMAGTYKVVYSLLDGDSKVIATSEFELNIAGVSTEYTISAPVNSENIVPSTVATKDKDGNATVVTFPAVDEIIIKDSNGETLTYGKIQDLDMDIVLATPTADNSATINWNANERKLTVDATKEVNTTYTALYSLVKNGTKLANVKMSFVAKKDYTAPTYTYSYVGTKPSTAEIGVKTKLPSINATSTDGKENVDVYYTIKITHTNSITKEEETYTPNMAGNEVLTVENGEFTFIPNDTGSFVVEYIIKDFNGNAPTTSTTKFSIDNVSQTTAPTPKVSLPYEDEGDGVDAIEAFKEVQLANNIMILPIDADDNANGYVENNLTLYRQIWDASKSGDEGLIYDESAIAVDDRQVTKALIFNEDDVNDINVYINGVTKTISKTTDMSIVDDTNAGWKTETKSLSEGTYVVKYFAKNKLSGKDEVMLSVPLKIVDTLSQDELNATPTVTFDATTTLPSSANLGDKITFKAPTATQKTVGSYSHTTLTTYVLYQLVVNGTPENTYHRYDEDNSWISLNEEKTEYTLSIPENRIDVTAINVFACAKNDLGNVNDFENDTKVAKQINIVGTGDTQATSIVSVTDTVGEKKQGQKVVLPSVTYNDDLPQFLNVKIVIDGDEQAYNGVYDIDGSEVEFSDAYFTPEEAKTYTISYISIDAGRNQTILTFTLDVAPDAATFNANFISLPSTISSGSAELGDKISIPSVDVKVSHPDDLVAEDWYVVIQGPANVSTDNKTYATFNKVGEYTIQYFCNVHNQVSSPAYNETIKSEKYTIKVTDTKGPQLLNKVAIDDCFNDITKNGALAKNKTTIRFVTVMPEDAQQEEDSVYVVLPQAKDVVYKDSTLSIVASGITLKTYHLNDLETLEDGLLLSRNDVYQFTFTLKDANGNTTTTDTYKVDVGDVYAPEVKVEDGVVASNYTVGDTVNIDFSKITVTDDIFENDKKEKVDVITKTEDGKYVLKDGYKLTITVTGTNDSDSLTVSDTINSDKKSNLEAFFKFTGLAADEYTLKVAVTDASTKVGTNSDITFKVSAESKSPISGEDVLGIVLIVVAVVALGGVVTYFVVTRKKAKNRF